MKILPQDPGSRDPNVLWTLPPDSADFSVSILSLKSLKVVPVFCNNCQLTPVYMDGERDTGNIENEATNTIVEDNLFEHFFYIFFFKLQTECYTL